MQCNEKLEIRKERHKQIPWIVFSILNLAFETQGIYCANL